MGASQRRKGHDFERLVARLHTEHGIPAQRALSECRDGNTGDLVFPEGHRLTVQAKCGAAPNVWQALREAVEAAPEGHLPVAIVRRNGAGSRPPEDLAVLRLADLLPRLRVLLAPQAHEEAPGGHLVPPAPSVAVLGHPTRSDLSPVRHPVSGSSA